MYQKNDGKMAKLIEESKQLHEANSSRLLTFFTLAGAVPCRAAPCRAGCALYLILHTLYCRAGCAPLHALEELPEMGQIAIDYITNYHHGACMHWRACPRVSSSCRRP